MSAKSLVKSQLLKEKEIKMYDFATGLLKHSNVAKKFLDLGYGYCIQMDKWDFSNSDQEKLEKWVDEFETLFSHQNEI